MKPFRARVALTVSLSFLMACFPGRNIEFRQNGERAFHSMESIRGAEDECKNRRGGYCGLGELGALGVLDPSLLDGEDSGYKFKVTADANTYRVTAVPIEYGETASSGTGYLSFYLDESRIIRAADKHGAEATEKDRPLERWHGH
jgi:hypothetical protein